MSSFVVYLSLYLQISRISFLRSYQALFVFLVGDKPVYGQAQELTHVIGQDTATCKNRCLALNGEICGLYRLSI